VCFDGAGSGSSRSDLCLKLCARHVHSITGGVQFIPGFRTEGPALCHMRWMPWYISSFPICTVFSDARAY